jgi:hypothetical protein
MARELAAQGAEGTPPLDPDRVWVLDTGRAKLLDDPTTDPSSPDVPDGRRFLHEMVRRLRSRTAAPWPVSAERLVRDVATAPLGETLTRLERELQARTTTTRLRRLAALALLVLPALVAFGIGLSLAWLAASGPVTPPQLRFPMAALRELKPVGTGYAVGRAIAGYRELTCQDRMAIEVFLAFRHRAALADERVFDPAYNPGASHADRIIVARVRQRIPVDPRDGEAAAANPRVQRLVRSVEATDRPSAFEGAVGVLCIVLTMIAIGGLLLALACRGVVLRLFGLELVTADGALASRGRVCARAAIAWSPLLVAAAPFYSKPYVTIITSFTVVEAILFAGAAVLGAGAVYTVVNPTRGIQDRLAGTWIVPR